MQTFIEFLAEQDGPRMVGDTSGGIFRKIKTTVGHAMPDRVRSAAMVPVVTGKMMGADTPADKERYRSFRSSLIAGTHKLPKFPDS